MKQSLFVLLCAIFFGCHSHVEMYNNDAETNIIIQPFEGTSKSNVLYVYEALSKIYPRVMLNEEIPYPKDAYYAPRNRYRADSLIRFLSGKTGDGNITIGLTNKDISVTKIGKKDWGIMGLGYRPGKASVASTFRLSKRSLNDQFFKVVIHEIGHNEGLPHCKNISCFMQDAEGSNKTDQLHDFCTNCKNHLLQRGWNLN